MEIALRGAEPSDFAFAFEAKRQALGPHIISRWGWDEQFQLDVHRTRWDEHPWSIILADRTPIGTVSVGVGEAHIQFGEFYILPSFQGHGIGTLMLRTVLDKADHAALPVKLEYLKWNPVGTLYRRHGFEVVAENDRHYFMVRQPNLG